VVDGDAVNAKVIMIALQCSIWAYLYLPTVYTDVKWKEMPANLGVEQQLC
jgi:hypothetical protein